MQLASEMNAPQAWTNAPGKTLLNPPLPCIQKLMCSVCLFIYAASLSGLLWHSFQSFWSAWWRFLEPLTLWPATGRPSSAQLGAQHG